MKKSTKKSTKKVVEIKAKKAGAPVNADGPFREGAGIFTFFEAAKKGLTRKAGEVLAKKEKLNFVRVWRIMKGEESHGWTWSANFDEKKDFIKITNIKQGKAKKAA